MPKDQDVMGQRRKLGKGMMADDDPTPEQEAACEQAMDWIEGHADKWAAKVNLTAMIKNALHVARLNRSAPADVREKFIARAEAQVDAIARQCFLEGWARCQEFRRNRKLGEGMMDWQPIETAPKDGTPILLWCDFEDGQELAIAAYDPSPIRMTNPKHGAFVWVTLTGGGAIAERIPTHWMPLPAPPVCNASAEVLQESE